MRWDLLFDAGRLILAGALLVVEIWAVYRWAPAYLELQADDAAVQRRARASVLKLGLIMTAAATAMTALLWSW